MRRSLSLTAEGSAYYERISCLLRELNDANDLIISRGKPRGKLTVSTSLDFGQWLLVQSIPEFLAPYPEIQIDLRLSDRVVDLVTEGIDVAIRLGTLEDSRLMVRSLGQTQFVLCAAPSYLKTHGIPATPNDLIHHNCLQYMFQGRPEPWMFWVDQEWQSAPVKGSFHSDNGGALKNAAIVRLGITRLLGFQVKQEVEQGQLMLLLPNEVSPGLAVHALFTHQRNLSPRVRVFLEFLNGYCKQFLGELEKNLKMVRENQIY